MQRITETDRRDLEALGLDADEAARQLEAMAKGPPRLPLLRPATPGDGIVVDQVPGETPAADEAVAQGRVSAFVPASGAATRLAKALVAAHTAGEPRGDRTVAAWLDAVPHLPLWPLLVRKGAVAGDRASTLAALVGEGGWKLQQLPKALVPFHWDEDGHARTAFEDQLAETAALVRDADDRVRATFTVAPHHEAAFVAALEHGGQKLADALGCTFEVDFVTQDPATDVPAGTAEGGLFRDADGQPVRRPGGHGALLRNLDALAADLVMVKNIDNVVAEADRGPIVAWRRLLLDLMVTVQGEAWALVRRIRATPDDVELLEEAVRWVRSLLGVTLPGHAEPLLDRLVRPWRVAGMVPVRGEPGGGPFWVSAPDGATVQIVEGAQMLPDQEALAAAGTHFNPVDMVLGLRGPDGERFALADFTDPGAYLVADKSHQGVPVRALEHPGLWNGGMARWNSVFVEVPGSTFHPVKTFGDLVRRVVHP